MIFWFCVSIVFNFNYFLFCFYHCRDRKYCSLSSFEHQRPQLQRHSDGRYWGDHMLCDAWWKCINESWICSVEYCKRRPNIFSSTPSVALRETSVMCSDLTSRVVLWSGTSKTSADTDVSPLITSFEEFAHRELWLLWRALIQNTRRKQRLVVRRRVSVSDQWSWHFTDGGRAVSHDASYWLTGQPASATILEWSLPDGVWQGYLWWY